MNNIGVIAEYNPFHNGHSYHLAETRKKSKCDNIVVIMTGDFVQRGEAAAYDKWTRAEMAVKGGGDLVIELPFIFACNNAEYFAYGAVKILDSLKAVTAISFGSESGSAEKLMPLAEILSFESEEFKACLKDKLSRGLSFPKARYETVKQLTNDETADLLIGPNNILALEYLKQLILQKSSMKAITVKRQGHHHYESATYIRNALAGESKMKVDINTAKEKSEIEDLVPKSTLNIMKNAGREAVTDYEKLFDLLVYKVLTSSEKDLAEILSSGEGLEYKLKKAIIDSKSYRDLLDAMFSKRYTQTRIQRLLIHTLMNLTRENYFRMAKEGRLYARVLAFSQSGAQLLRHIKNNELSTIPILTNINKEAEINNPLWEVLKYDIVASDIYNLCFNGGLYDRSDHVVKPYGAEI